MTIKFEQLSSASGFMKHNGGLLFRTISEDQYEFKTIVTENHLNRVKITHGGYIASIIDAGLGTAASRCCLLYTSPSPRDKRQSRMPSSA